MPPPDLTRWLFLCHPQTWAFGFLCFLPPSFFKQAGWGQDDEAAELLGTESQLKPTDAKYANIEFRALKPTNQPTKTTANLEKPTT